MRTILVVDDSAICREPIALALSSKNYEVICASSGAEALTLLRERQPDLVLLDVNMPELDGHAVLRTMRRNPDLTDIPVIMLTEKSGREDVAWAIEQRAQGYFLKSEFSIDELFARIEACLSGEPVAAAASAAAEKMSTDNAYTQWRLRSEKSMAAAEKAPSMLKAPVAMQGNRLNSAVPAGQSRQGSGNTARTVADLSPVIGRVELVKLVTDGLELRPLGISVQNVMSVSTSAECSPDDLAKAISQDQALCIRILRTANSSAYSRGKPVNSIKLAIQRLGIQEIRNLIMALGVVDDYEQSVSEHIDVRFFWEHSIACGLIASALAKACDSKWTDDCFLWGLLHDVGRLVFLDHASDCYVGVLEMADALDAPLEQVEVRMMLMDHCDILAKALEHWRFSPEFICPVVNHHRSVSRIKDLGPKHVQSAAIVALSDRMAHALLLGSSGNDVIYPMDDLVELLGLEPYVITKIANAIPDETNSLKFTMLARAGSDNWPEFLSDAKAKIGTHIRPLCISQEPQVNAYQMFLERLLSPLGDQTPNLAVLYLRDAREQPQLITALEEQEDAAGIAALPIVVICNKGKIRCEDEWLQARRGTVLRTPVRFTSLLSAIENLLR